MTDRLGARAPLPELTSLLFEEPPRLRGRARLYASWLFWLAAIAIAVASMMTIVRLLDHADTRRQTQIVLADLSVLASRLRLAELRAELDPSAMSAFLTAASVAAEELPRELSELLAFDPEGDAADRVREAVEQYQSNAEHHLELVQAGDETAARQWEQERSGPSYGLLQEATAQSGIFYSAQATRSLRWVRLSAAVAIGSEALLIGLLVGFSTRAQHRAERELHEERVRHAARFQAMVQHSADVIALLDERGTIRYVSPAGERVLGYPAEAAIGMSSLAFLGDEGVPAAEAALREVLAGRGDVEGLELPAVHADGSRRWIEVSARNLLDDPNVGGIVLNFRDVTRSRQLKDQLQHQALHDPLTGLGTRELFGHQVETALARARREESSIALFYVDLDGFKAVNDSLGHDAGDDLLVEVAQRLRRTLRESETPARLGGDEFAVLLDGAGMEEAVAVAERILEALAAPFRLATGEASVGASIGIAVGGPEDANPDELLRRADLAMYLAKSRGKGRYEVCDDLAVLRARTTATGRHRATKLAAVAAG